MSKGIFVSILILIIVARIYSQIPANIQYEQTFDRCVKYEATLLQHNSKLYVDAKGGIEEYQILADGSLELISYISTLHYCIANAIILGDSLFVATEDENRYKIFVINIADSPMEIVNIIDTNSTNTIFKMAGNEDYFMYNSSFDTSSYVHNRNTLTFVTSIPTGGYYTVYENYLFYELVCNDSSFLAIADISDINNIVPIDTLYVGLDQQNIGYFFYDDLLFISQNTQIVILNISDVYNPVIISTISNIPNVSSVNFFTLLIKYNNYLVFGNKETLFWVYDISDLSSPQYVANDIQFNGGTSVKNSFILYENKVYYARTDRNICLFDADELPDLNILNEFGNCGHFQFYEFTYPYILYSDPCRYKQYCLKINDPEPEPICLADSPYSSVSTSCYNDSLICFFTADSGTKDLVICRYDETNIEVANTVPLGTSNFCYPFFRGDHLILCGLNPGEISINIINPDYSISEIGNFTVGTRAYLIDKTSQCSNDYLYIKSKYNGEYIIEVFENQEPFNQVSSFELICNYHEFDTFYFLEDDKVLLCDYYAPGGLYYLCNYTFPDTFELLDSFSSSTITFYLNDNYLFGHKDLDGDASFYTWQNDEIELVQSYEFEVEQYNAFLLPEESRFIAGGRYIVQEYSCDFVSVNDHQIPVSDAQLSNYPNPFNPSTTIQFETTNLHKFAQIEIYNIKGQKVKTLPVSPSPGHKVSVIWDGTNDTGQTVGSGVYFYQLQIDKNPIASRKCLLLK